MRTPSGIAVPLKEIAAQFESTSGHKLTIRFGTTPELVKMAGEAELGVFLLNVLTDPRLDIVGPFPANVQREVVYVAGVAANSTTPDTAKAFITYLMSPAGAAVLKAKGMTPG